MPKTLKLQVVRLAEADGISINAWINTAITHRVGREVAAAPFFQFLRDGSDPATALTLLKQSQED
jgi:hypothetical protein